MTHTEKVIRLLTSLRKVLGRKKLQTIELYRRLRVYATHRDILARNHSLKNSLSGKKCFIIGNGPSLANQDISGIVGLPCITVSNGFVHPLFRELKPEFHVFAMGHKPITESQLRAWFEDAEKFFSPGQKIFMCVTDRVTVDKFGLFKKQKVFYYSPGNRSAANVGTIDVAHMLPKTHTVIHLALYLAFHLGVQEITLLGCDHDWIRNIGVSRHFYAENEHAMKREGLREWGTDMQKFFLSYVNLWERYKEIREYANRHRITIYNATPDSLLDVFPKKELSEIIQTPRR